MVRLYNIHAGKKVLILENIIYNVDDLNVVDVLATKGSIGIVLSYEEYCAHVLQGINQDSNSRHLAWVKSAIGGTHYPVRFEEVIPLPDEEYVYFKTTGHFVNLQCEVGSIVMLPTLSCKFIENIS